MTAEYEAEYVAARRTLLDGLFALGDHVQSMILVGAQAIYMHTGDPENLAITPMTTDADLAIDVSILATTPDIGAMLVDAGFASDPNGNPGRWTSSQGVFFDLMVASHQSGTEKRTARAARLATHDQRTARIVRGLEPALIDNSGMAVRAFEDGDSREIQIKVAGPAALLAAKAIKIGERLTGEGARPDRVKAKDALDAFRLVQAIDTAELVQGLRSHLADQHARDSTELALEILREHGTGSDGRLPRMAMAAGSRH